MLLTGLTGVQVCVSYRALQTSSQSTELAFTWRLIMAEDFRLFGVNCGVHGPSALTGFKLEKSWGSDLWGMH